MAPISLNEGKGEMVPGGTSACRHVILDPEAPSGIWWMDGLVVVVQAEGRAGSPKVEM